MPVDRRHFLTTLLFATSAMATERIPRGGGFPFNAAAKRGYGPVGPAAAEGTGEVFLGLPEDFRYSILSRVGQTMSDGNPTPRSPDGMAAFVKDGLIRLVRNHEIGGSPQPIAPFSPVYDHFGGGGCTTVMVDPVSRRLIADFVTLNGTVRNCNGGSTPWGSWISAEESLAGAASGQAKPHGYCFEVPASAESAISPVPLKAMGRFNHEAVVVDPETGIAYLTEDTGQAGFYRFVPDVSGDFSRGGRLQMLGIPGMAGAAMSKVGRLGETVEVNWIDLPDPDPANAEEHPDAVARQGRSLGAAVFNRLEGATYLDDAVYFASTEGGKANLGQIWRYSIRSAGRRRAVRPAAPQSSSTLTLVYEATDRSVFGFPDSLCPGPNGSLLMCEDGGSVPHSLRVLTPDGQVFELVRNLIPGYEKTEFTGATFSPDGATLFLNAQIPGLTFAIWGPWDLQA